MTKQELLTKFNLTEPELYVYACLHLKGFQECAPHERGRGFSERALRKLEQMLGKEREDAPGWADDPAAEEPDDNEVDFRSIYPDETEPSDGMDNQAKTDSAFAAADDNAWKTKFDLLEAEKEEWAKQATTYKHELASLRHEYLTAQRDAAAKQEEILAQASKDRKNADAKISALKEDVAAQKHLAAVRIKEVEDRNDALERQLMKTREEYSLQAEELMNLQHAIQDLRDTANKKGTQQALELLDAQGQQEKLCKTIHEKDLEIMEAKEKQQEIVGKYNAALQRIGEIIGKVMKTRERMQESFAEFDVYIDAEKEETNEAMATAEPVSVSNEPPAPEPLPPAHTVPNPETVQILGKPVGETPTVPESVIKEQAKPTLWRRIASLF